MLNDITISDIIILTIEEVNVNYACIIRDMPSIDASAEQQAND